MNAAWRPAAIGNYRQGRVSPISQITYHHIVGDAAAAIARFQKSGEAVSSTYVIGSDGTLYQCVEEGNTPYTDANAASNARSITIEHAGGLASVPYTEAMYATSIALTRDLIRSYGISSFKRHRDVSDTPTACPGQLDVERIVKAAQGDDMAEKTTLSTMRILTNGIFGHNGLSGRQNALTGTEDSYLTDNWVGRELTNELIEELFYSAQARQWRDSQDPDSVTGITKRLQAMAGQGEETQNLIEDIQALIDKYRLR